MRPKPAQLAMAAVGVRVSIIGLIGAFEFAGRRLRASYRNVPMDAIVALRRPNRLGRIQSS